MRAFLKSGWWFPTAILLAFFVVFVEHAVSAPRAKTAQSLLPAALKTAKQFWAPRTSQYGAVKIKMAYLGEDRNADFTGSNPGVIRVNSWQSWNVEGDWSMLCITVLHEYGHAVMGPAYAATNPKDPWHSVARTSVMQANQRIYDLKIPLCRRAPWT